MDGVTIGDNLEIDESQKARTFDSFTARPSIPFTKKITNNGDTIVDDVSPSARTMYQLWI